MTADRMYDTAKIGKYNRKRGIKSNIPVNKRNRKKKKRKIMDRTEKSVLFFP
jgi:hypothetical protein